MKLEYKINKEIKRVATCPHTNKKIVQTRSTKNKNETWLCLHNNKDELTRAENIELDRLDVINEYTNEILEVIENKDDYTQSDLQGVIEAIIMKMSNI